MRRLALVIPGLAVAALVAGCGSGSPKASTSFTGAVTPPPSTVTDTVSPPPTTTTAVATATTSTGGAPSGPGACATTNLTVSMGQPQGAAGSTIYALRFTNSGSASCTLTGYPGVSYVAPGSGQQVGKAAVRENTATPVVTLTQGAEATAAVRATNDQDIPPAQCQSTAVSGFRVYPPDNKAAAYVAFPHPSMACTIGPSQLRVQSVVAGAGG